jgi:hypothetical protein
MMVKCGQVWQIKEYVRTAKNISYSHIFITKVVIDKMYGDVVWFEALGHIHHFESRTNQSYLTWLTVNCELVSG